MALSTASSSSGCIPIYSQRDSLLPFPSSRSCSTSSDSSTGSTAASSVESFAKESIDSHSTDASITLFDGSSNSPVNSSPNSSIKPLLEPCAKSSPVQLSKSSIDTAVQDVIHQSLPSPPETLFEMPDQLPRCHTVQLCLFVLRNKCRGIRQHIPAFNALLTKLGYNDPSIPIAMQDKLRILARRTILQLAQKMEKNGAIRVTNRKCIKRKLGMAKQDTGPSEEIEFAVWTQEWEAREWDGDLRCPQGWELLDPWGEKGSSDSTEQGGEKEIFIVEEQDANVVVPEDQDENIVLLVEQGGCLNGDGDSVVCERLE